MKEKVNLDPEIEIEYYVTSMRFVADQTEQLDSTIGSVLPIASSDPISYTPLSIAEILHA